MHPTTAASSRLLTTRRLTNRTAISSTHGASNRHGRLLDVACAFLLSLAAVYVFWDAGRPFVQTDDFWYAGIVREMLARGDWLTPHFNGLPHFGNPPLAHWFDLPFVAAIPHLQIAMRVVPGLCFLAVLALLYRLARNRFSGETGFLALLICGLCYDHLYNHGYKAAGMEGVLNLELLAAFWLNVRLPERPSSLRWLGVLTGLVFMTKTAFAAVPLGLTALNLWWLRREVRVPRRLVLESAGLAVLVGAPWFIAMAALHGPEVLEQMFGLNVWKRAVGDPTTERIGRLLGRREPLYAFRHYFTYGQPWSLLVWPALLSLRERWDALGASARRILGLAAAWHLFLLAVFLLSRGRWGWYISSIYIPAALLIAWFLAEVKHGRLPAYLPAVLALAASACVVVTPPFRHNPFAVPAGNVPLAFHEWQQLAAAAGLLFVFQRLRPATATDQADAGTARPVSVRAPVFMSCTALLAVGVAFLRAQHPGRFEWVRWVPAGLAAWLLYDWLRRGAARAVATAAVIGTLVLGAGYLAAPFRYAFREQRRAELEWMETLIRRGFFKEHARYVWTDVSYYLYVVLAQSYAPAYEFTYANATRTLTIRKTSGEAREGVAGGRTTAQP